MMVGQNVAAIPDHPKIANQNTVRSGVITATLIAIISAVNAMPRVTSLDKRDKVLSSTFGLMICW